MKHLPVELPFAAQQPTSANGAAMPTRLLAGLFPAAASLLGTITGLDRHPIDVSSVRGGTTVGVALISLIVAFVSACALHVRPSPDVWQLRGTVIAVSGTSLQVRHKSGQVVDLAIDDQTEFVRNRNADSRESLDRGTRVTVDVETHQNGSYRARRVEMFGGSPTW